MSDVRRTYRSPVRNARAQETRRRIVEAAIAHLTDDGYAATSIRAIAATADVSVPTVELAFGAKRHLLAAAIDVATAGDDGDMPMLTRPAVTAIEGHAEPTQYLRAVCELIAEIQPRSAGVILAAREAAHVDTDARTLTADIDRRRHQIAHWIASGARKRMRTRTADHHVTTTWVLIDPAVYIQLTSHAPSTYSTWLFDALGDVLLTPTAGRSRP